MIRAAPAGAYEPGLGPESPAERPLWREAVVRFLTPESSPELPERGKPWAFDDKAIPAERALSLIAAQRLPKEALGLLK